MRFKSEDHIEFCYCYCDIVEHTVNLSELDGQFTSATSFRGAPRKVRHVQAKALGRFSIKGMII